MGSTKERILAQPFLSLARFVSRRRLLPNFVTSALNECEQFIYNILYTGMQRIRCIVLIDGSNFFIAANVAVALYSEYQDFRTPPASASMDVWRQPYIFVSRRLKQTHARNDVDLWTVPSQRGQ